MLRNTIMIAITKYTRVLLVGLLLLPTLLLAQGQDTSRQELEAIDDQVQTLKSEVIQINHELSLLEEKLLFPSTTQTAVFVSLDSQFTPDSVQLSLNGETVSNHIYTFREIEALQKGGVQKLYTGNVPVGTHQLLVEFRGRSTAGKPAEKTATYSFKKEIEPKFVELKLTGADRQPEITFKDW